MSHSCYKIHKSIELCIMHSKKFKRCFATINNPELHQTRAVQYTKTKYLLHFKRPI